MEASNALATQGLLLWEAILSTRLASKQTNARQITTNATRSPLAQTPTAATIVHAVLAFVWILGGEVAESSAQKRLE